MGWVKPPGPLRMEFMHFSIVRWTLESPGWKTVIWLWCECTAPKDHVLGTGALMWQCSGVIGKWSVV